MSEIGLALWNGLWERYWSLMLRFLVTFTPNQHKYVKPRVGLLQTQGLKVCVCRKILVKNVTLYWFALFIDRSTFRFNVAHYTFLFYLVACCCSILCTLPCAWRKRNGSHCQIRSQGEHWPKSWFFGASYKKFLRGTCFISSNLNVFITLLQCFRCEVAARLLTTCFSYRCRSVLLACAPLFL